jgi:transposase
VFTNRVTIESESALLLPTRSPQEGRRAQTRDVAALEQRRRQAATLLRQGVWSAEVAQRLGGSRQSVSRWAKTGAEHGRQGLRRAGRVGRTPPLTPADLKRVERALKAGPEAHGYATGLWNLPRVVTWVETECGVRFGKTRVWQLVRALGWSCQRPTGQARERDAVAIRRGKRVEWPRLKKPLPPKAAPASSSTSRG